MPAGLRVSRAWRWSLVRRAVQATGVLSAKTSASVLHPTLGGSKRQPCHGSPHWYFCSSVFVRLLLLRLAIPTLVLPSTRRVGRRAKKPLTPCYILAQWGCGHRCGRAEGFVLQNGASWVPRPFAEEHPRALHPWAVPWGATELPQQRAGDAGVPPSWCHVFPNHLKPTSF